MGTGKGMAGHMNNRNDKAARDYLAIGVFVAALIVLIVSGYYLIRTYNKASIGKPVDIASKWLKNAYRGVENREAKKYLTRAYKLYQREKYTKALGEYDKAIQIDQDNFKAYFWRGRTYIRIERYEDAIADFKMVVNLKPDYIPAYDNLGWLYSRREEYDESIIYLTKSLELEPRNGWAYYYRGRNFFLKGDLVKALNDEEKACELGYQQGCIVYQEYKNTIK